MILADIQIGGRTRKVLMQANKGGFFYVLDRITGQFISATPFSPVNWASGFDEKGRPQIPAEAYYSPTTSVLISPSAGGAANWAPRAYSPQTGLVYMPVSGFSNRQYIAVPFDAPPASRAIQENGTPRGGRVPAGTPEPSNPPLIGPQGVRGGYLVAFDPVTRTERWRNAGGGGNGGGALATAGNIVFQVVNDGRLLAYTAADGKQLLEIRTGQTGMGPPITYQLDGKQYISFLGGTGGQRGRGGEPVPPRMYTFVLDGNAPMPAAP